MEIKRYGELATLSKKEKCYCLQFGCINRITLLEISVIMCSPVQLYVSHTKSCLHKDIGVIFAAVSLMYCVYWICYHHFVFVILTVHMVQRATRSSCYQNGPSCFKTVPSQFRKIKSSRNRWDTTNSDRVVSKIMWNGRNFRVISSQLGETPSRNFVY